MSMETNSPQREGDSIPVPTEDPHSLGEIKINLSVISNIVRLAALDVPGVISVSSSIKDGIAEIFSKESERGVKVLENDAGEYEIEIHVILRFGVKLDRTAAEIQQTVFDQVRNMTSKSVRAINVFIDGVKIDKPADKESAESDV